MGKQTHSALGIKKSSVLQEGGSNQPRQRLPGSHLRSEHTDDIGLENMEEAGGLDNLNEAGDGNPGNALCPTALCSLDRLYPGHPLHEGCFNSTHFQVSRSAASSFYRTTALRLHFLLGVHI